MGGGTAGLVQTGTALLCGASTATTGGLANPVLATLENTLAVGGVALMLLLPLVAAGLVVLLMVFILARLRRWRTQRRSRPGVAGAVQVCFRANEKTMWPMQR